MTVGLFGGSFNPPHTAHLIIAEAIRTEFAFDQISIASRSRSWNSASRWCGWSGPRSATSSPKYTRRSRNELSEACSWPAVVWARPAGPRVV